MTRPDGSATVERSERQQELTKRWIQLGTDMRRDAWAGPRPRDF